MFSNSAEELVVTSGVIMSDGKLIGEVLWIFIEALFEMVNVNKSSTVLQEEKKIDRKAVSAISFDFIVNLNGFCLNTNFWIVWIFLRRY
ncbi:hypothetical protein D3C72_2357650 [compost metagenome]